MYFWTNYSGFNGKIVGKIVVMPSWDVYLAYQAVKILATADLILYKTALLVTGRCFKLTNSPCIFERRAVTSPTTLVSKGRHCHWDYIFLQLKARGNGTFTACILKTPFPGRIPTSCWRHVFTFASVHASDADVTFDDGLGMHTVKAAKQVYNSTWMALLKHGIVLIKTWLFIAFGTGFCAIIPDNERRRIYYFADQWHFKRIEPVVFQCVKRFLKHH